MTEGFRPRKMSDVADLIAEHPLAWIACQGPAGCAASVAPLLAERGEDGEVAALLGHVARANPLADLLLRQPAVLILFQGPHAYVAPHLVSRPQWAPTWNYAVVWFEARVELVPDETAQALERLAAHLERGRADPWRPAMMGARRDAMLPRIVAFRAHVQAVHPRFKLGQDEAPTTFDEILRGLDDPDLARWMRRTVRPDDDAAHPSAAP